MTRTRWLDVASAIFMTLLDLLPPGERDSASEELLARIRSRRARSTSSLAKPPPVPREEP
jgi:hypothetical protein